MNQRFADACYVPGVALMLLLAACPGPPFIDHLAGTPLTAAPYFHHREVLLEGENLWVGLDPNKYPAKVGHTYSIYVVAHKTASQWQTDHSLTDVTGTVETATLVAGTLQANQRIAWAGTALGSLTHRWHRDYDVVFDFNSNGKYDKKKDILDRIGTLETPGAEETGGVTVIRDPATAGDFPVATHDYNLGSFAVTVPPAYAESGDPLTLSLIGRMYYPAASAGVDQPVNTAFATYPVIVIAHGRTGVTTSYTGYEYLARHLASRGFICASIDLYALLPGWRIHHRGVTILKHVRGLLLEPTTDATILQVRARMDPGRVGLVGHSRGGEGIVAAEQIWEGTSSPGYTLRALAAFSPTDGPNWSETAPGSGPYNPSLPYLLLYGSRDGDVSGYAGNDGIRTFDRAQRPRNMIFIHGANHNFFNSVWSTDGSPTISRTDQETLAKAFMTAFFHARLLDEQAFVELLSGYAVPPSVAAVPTTILYADQSKRWISRTVDNAEDSPLGPATNSLGQPNTSAGLAEFTEESIRYATIPDRNYYADDTRGLRTRWILPGGSVAFGTGTQSVRYWDFLNFRVGQRFRSTGSFNPTNGMQNLTIVLEDADGHVSPPIRVSTYVTLPYPDDRGSYTKSVMRTVRIPLRAFSANGSALNPGRLARIRFLYDATATGELLIDDVEFLGLDLSEPEP